LRDLKVTHQKNQPHPSLEKNELPPKKIKMKIKKCPGPGPRAAVPWCPGGGQKKKLKPKIKIGECPGSPVVPIDR
jgi:hypothetical protein